MEYSTATVQSAIHLSDIEIDKYFGKPNDVIDLVIRHLQDIKNNPSTPQMIAVQRFARALVKAHNQDRKHVFWNNSKQRWVCAVWLKNKRHEVLTHRDFDVVMAARNAFYKKHGLNYK